MKLMLDANNSCTDICMMICYFRSPISPWMGPATKTIFGAFFLDMFYIFTMPKTSLVWGPVQPFLNKDHDFGHICFLKNLWNFFGTKSGSYSGQKIISFSLGVFFDWETSIYFCPLFVHFRTLGDTLTYSAMTREEDDNMSWIEGPEIRANKSFIILY